MVGNLLDQNILQIFNNDLTKFYSINAIAKKLNKAYPHINQKVNALIDEGIIKKTIFGRSYICRIDMNSDLAIAYLTIEEIRKKQCHIKNLPKKTINEIENLDCDLVFIHHGKIYAVNPKSNQSKNIIFLTNKEFQKLIIEKDLLTNHVLLKDYGFYFSTLKKLWGQIRLKEL